MRLLVVAYYFPPAGGAGVQRVLKWVKYLREFGIEPVVLTVEAGAYPKHDTSLLADIPDGIEVHRTASFDLFGLYGRLTGRSRQEAVADQLQSAPRGLAERLARWVRANLVLPDARIGWVPFARRAARHLHRRAPFDAVLTSGPPHSVHLVGRTLHRQGIPWIADFRDPWTDIYYYEKLPRTVWARRFDESLERSVLATANAATVVSPGWRALLAGKVGCPPEPFTVIHNGYDEADFAGVEAEPSPEHFVLTHVGTLYGVPTAVWRAVARLVRGGEAEHLRLRLVGHVPDDVTASLHEAGLEAVTEIRSYVPHDEAVLEMASATLLLLTIEEWPHAEGLMTGKLYEYLASGRPVLGLGPPEGDAASLLAEVGGGVMLGRSDEEGVYRHMLGLYRRWAAGERLHGAESQACRPYTRRAQTGHLAAVVRKAVARGRR